METSLQFTNKQIDKYEVFYGAQLELIAKWYIATVSIFKMCQKPR